MAILEDQFGQLKIAFPEAQIQPKLDGSAIIRLPGIALPSGWNLAATDVVFVAPVGYPVAKPDTFWADERLRLAGGGMPLNTSLNANYGGPQQMLWFSFHPNVWNPQRDNLLTYAQLIRRRFADPK